MTRPRVTLYSFAFPHHGRYTSMHRLLSYSRNCRVIDASVPLRRQLSRGWYERVLRPWLRLNERRLRPIFSRQEPQCVHYIHPENSLFRGDVWKGPHRLVLTCHQPGESLREIARGPGFGDFFRALKHADRVVLLSKRSLPDYAAFCDPDRLVVIPHGVDVEFFRPPHHPAQCPLILTVGNWLRDYSLWADVATRLAAKHPTVTFAVVAVPMTVRDIQARAEQARGPRVRFLYGLSDEQLRLLYQETTVSFLPLVDAGANNGLLEGMASGLPIVASDLPAVREYAGDCAVLIPPGAANDCLAALEELLANSRRRAELGRASRERAMRHLAWQVIADRYAQLYAEVLATE